MQTSDSGFEETDRRLTRKGKRLLALLWVVILALMFGGAGINLIFRSSETADAFIGIFLVAISVFSRIWVYRKA